MGVSRALEKMNVEYRGPLKQGKKFLFYSIAAIVYFIPLFRGFAHERFQKSGAQETGPKEGKKTVPMGQTLVVNGSFCGVYGLLVVSVM